MNIFLDRYCSTVQGLLDWFEVNLEFPELVLFRLILLSYVPPEKLFRDGFSTHMLLFCLICTIISIKTCILD